MNQMYFSHPKINNNKRVYYFVPVTREYEKTMTDQISEIFIDEQYKRGKIKKDMDARRQPYPFINNSIIKT